MMMANADGTVSCSYGISGGDGDGGDVSCSGVEWYIAAVAAAAATAAALRDCCT